MKKQLIGKSVALLATLMFIVPSFNPAGADDARRDGIKQPVMTAATGPVPLCAPPSIPCPF